VIKALKIGLRDRNVSPIRLIADSDRMKFAGRGHKLGDGLSEMRLNEQVGFMLNLLHGRLHRHDDDHAQVPHLLALDKSEISALLSTKSTDKAI
jgi:hypothetical protein